MLLLFALALAIVVAVKTASAQIYLPSAPPHEPSEYGRVILNTHTSAAAEGGVVFDHWLHRSKFTCRLCHVDIGFAMRANTTGVRAETNRQGFHCGACHDGKKIFDGKTIFAACSNTPFARPCARCHSLSHPGAREYEYKSFTASFPKAYYGIEWEVAERNRVIKPVDFVEGLSVKRPPMQSRDDFAMKAGYSWVHPIGFSHEKHSTWNGCELCHPEIFPSVKKGTVRYSMFYNIEGRYCGSCHGKVAFPLNRCSQCHSNAPPWAQQ